MFKDSWRVVFAIVLILCSISLVASADAEKVKTAVADDSYRPDMNAIPELYPEKYPGLTAPQAPHDVPLPLQFNWCSQHVCSPNLQQHITYTPLCFLHASLHMLSDRINFEVEKEKLGVPAVYLSRQDYLDFAHNFGYGQNPLEDGGEGVDVMEYARQAGIPDETCNPWKSDGQNHQSTHLSKRCQNCMMLRDDKVQHCWDIEKFVKYRVESYGFVRGEIEMMNEIFHRGPIQCGVVVDDEMIYNYAGGIYNDHGRLAHAEVDHDVEVIGFGEIDQEMEALDDTDRAAVEKKDDKKSTTTKTVKQKYWIVRNSWGSNIWGTNGVMLVARGVNAMRIEERCLFALPDISELKAHLQGDNVGTMFGLIDPRVEKPRVLPPNWDKEPHDYMTKEELAEGAEASKKLDDWMNKYINTPLSDERRAERNKDIVIGAPSGVKTSALEWVFGVTGMITVGILLAAIGALWLYCSQSSSDDYQPIPQL